MSKVLQNAPIFGIFFEWLLKTGFTVIMFSEKTDFPQLSKPVYVCIS